MKLSAALIARKAKQYWPVIPLLLILFALMLSDLDVMGYSPFGTDPCGLKEIDQTGVSAKAYDAVAGWALKYTPSPSVAIVYIDPTIEPAELQTNTCASRVFLAGLVGDLEDLGVQEIVIDKYYAANSCADQAKNDVFVTAMQQSRVPIVVGQATHSLPATANASGCLALTDRMEFDTPKVRYGLTRLNDDTLKIPLRWPVFAAAETQAAAKDTAAKNTTPAELRPLAPATVGDGLSLVAARLHDANIDAGQSSVKTLLDAQVHPYTKFEDLPNIHAMVARCSAAAVRKMAGAGVADDGPAAVTVDSCAKFVRPVDDLDGNHLSLAGKIVVIGDLSEQDMQSTPDGDKPGVYLQANYVQALLDHRFLREIPTPLTLTVLVLFVIGVYCLYWAHDGKAQPRLTAEQAGIGSLVVLLVFVLLALIGLLGFSLYTPLWALWGAGVFLLFRYLEASGHHRSQHLMGQLAGLGHRGAEGLEEPGEPGSAAKPVEPPAAESPGGKV